jgi:hypothetical protein
MVLGNIIAVPDPRPENVDVPNPAGVTKQVQELDHPFNPASLALGATAHGARPDPPDSSRLPR